MAASDVIVVGGGLIGCSVARELARHGVRVLLIERKAVGAEASGAAAGTLAAQAEAAEPGPLVDLCLRSRELFAGFVEALREETGLDCDYGTAGILYCALGDADEVALRRRIAWQQAAGLPVERVNRDDVLRLVPDAAPAVRWAVHFPRDHWLDPRRLASAAGAAAEAAGVKVASPQTALRVAGENGRVTGVECDGTTYSSACVVNAAGSWAGLLALPAGARRPPVTPLRGQMVAIGGARGRCEHALYSTAGYLVPRRDGRILAGSTYEDVGYRAENTVGGLATILAAATALVPALRRCAVVDAWAGLRPVTPDGLPVLGPSPEIGGLYYATGHGRHGILLAPLTARLIAELIVGGATTCEVEPFLPGRFAAAATGAAPVTSVM